MIIGLYKQLQAENEYVISKQFLRSGTSIGANVEEATAAQSRRDFLAKMAVASKEARETKYWLRLLHESKLTQVDMALPLERVEELIRMLTAIVKTTASHQGHSTNARKSSNSKLNPQNSQLSSASHQGHSTNARESSNSKLNPQNS